MKDNIKILLNRREEIKNEINKLEEEYRALGQAITELFNYKQKEKEKENGEKEL